MSRLRPPRRLVGSAERDQRLKELLSFTVLRGGQDPAGLADAVVLEGMSERVGLTLGHADVGRQG